MTPSNSFLRRLALTLTAAFLVASAALAQQAAALERLQVVLWPEYDQPATLVILRGYLPADATLPATVSLPMPSTVASPNAVAKRTPDGRLLLADYMREDQGDWSLMHISTDVSEVRIEYYTELQISGTRRQIVFNWPGGLNIGQVTYEVQQPLGAAQVAITPPATRQVAGNDGLTYFFAELGPKASADTFSIDVGYSKAMPGLTVTAMQPTFRPPAQPPPQEQTTPAPSGEGTISVWWFVLPIVFLVALVVLGLALSTRKKK